MERGGLFLVKVTYSELGSLYFSNVTNFQLDEVYEYIRRNERIQQALVLWTCNRFEVYFYPGDKETVEFVEDYVRGKSLQHSVIHGLDAVKHLFIVAAGLDSMVIGENEIVSQIRDALKMSEKNGLAGPDVTSIVNKALQIGKKVRTISGNGRHNKSVASIAIDQLRLTGGEKVLVIGAGQVGRQVSSILERRGIKFSLTNRTLEKAVLLSQSIGCGIEDFDASKWREYEVIISAAKAPSPLLRYEDVIGSRIRKILDLGVPPNVEERMPQGVEVISMKSLSEIVRSKQEEKEEFMRTALMTVNEEFDKFSMKMMNREKEEILRKIIEFSDKVIEDELRYMEKRVSTEEDIDLMRRGLESTRNRLLGFVINGIKRSKDVKSSETIANMEEILDENLSRREDEKVKKIR
ncbi:MAG: hypothetical protein ACP5UO_02540 [Thermoplasmata archaeon]